MVTLNVGSDGMGRWSYDLLLPLIRRTFPNTTITTDDSKSPELVIRSHFFREEMANPYSCPYITYSGEAYQVRPRQEYEPVLNIDTAYHPNSFYLPFLFLEVPHTERPDPTPIKRWCAAYAFSNRVRPREELFLQMRIKEPTCYAFGRSCHTNDNPFELGRGSRFENAKAFNEFGFVIAMENQVSPGYLTEKIGNAFCSGAVPIYWGDSTTVSDFFNPAAYLDVNDYASTRAAGLAAVEIWRDRQKLQKFLDAPLTLNSKLADYEAVRTEYRPWQKPFLDRLREAFPDLS